MECAVRLPNSDDELSAQSRQPFDSKKVLPLGQDARLRRGPRATTGTGSVARIAGRPIVGHFDPRNARRTRPPVP